MKIGLVEELSKQNGRQAAGFRQRALTMAAQITG